MDEKSRLQLQKMIKANDVADQTDLIRELKHSVLLRNDINNLMLLKAKYNNNQEEIINMGISECNFLFTYYTDIFNKIRKDEIDLRILFKFLDVLKQIEDGQLDQHEGSFAVGSLLKELYVDSALKKAEKLNKDNDKKEENKIEPINISWKQFKFSKKKN
jgi:hypothetical protein